VCNLVADMCLLPLPRAARKGPRSLKRQGLGNMSATAHGTKVGLRHVRGVRPNKAADFRGMPFWTLKSPYKLTFILPLIANADQRTRNTATRCVL